MKKTLLALAVAAALTSCSSYSLVNSTVYNNSALDQVHTFRIVTQDQGKLPPGMTSVTYYNIAAAIREQLVERGFTEDPNSPILVNIGLTVNKEVAYQAFTTPGTWVTPPIGWGSPILPPPGPSRGEDLPYVPQTDPGLVEPPASSGMHFINADNPQPLPAAPQAPAEPETQGLPNVGNPNPGPTPGPQTPPPPGPAYNGMVPWFMYPRSYYVPGPTQIVPSIYREGVLTMDIVDLSTQTPLYSSSVATILDAGDTQFRNLSGIAQAVKVLFKKFPVPLLPQYK